MTPIDLQYGSLSIGFVASLVWKPSRPSSTITKSVKRLKIDRLGRAGTGLTSLKLANLPLLLSRQLMMTRLMVGFLMRLRVGSVIGP